MIIVGGRASSNNLIHPVYTYDPSIDQWDTASQLIHPRYGHAIVEVSKYSRSCTIVGCSMGSVDWIVAEGIGDPMKRIEFNVGKLNGIFVE